MFTFQRQNNAIRVNVVPQFTIQQTSYKNDIDASSDVSGKLDNVTSSNKIKFSFPHLYAYFFNAAYFSLLSPFRYKVKDSSVELVSHKLQKLLCGLAYILVIIRSAMGTRVLSSQILKDNPETLFFLIESSSFYVLLFVLVKIMWSKDTQNILLHKTESASFKVKIKILQYPVLSKSNPNVT